MNARLGQRRMEERLLQFGGELRRLEESEKALGLEADRIAKTSIRDHEISKNSIARLLGVLQSHVTALIGKVREGRRESRGRSRCWSGTRRWSWSRRGHLKRVIARYLEREQMRTDHLRRIYDHLGTLLEGGAAVSGYLLQTDDRVLDDTERLLNDSPR
jgi:hypothetical protein